MHIDTDHTTHVEVEFLEHPLNGPQHGACLRAHIAERGMTFRKVSRNQTRKMRVGIIHYDLAKRGR